MLGEEPHTYWQTVDNPYALFYGALQRAIHNISKDHPERNEPVLQDIVEETRLVVLRHGVDPTVRTAKGLS